MVACPLLEDFKQLERFSQLLWERMKEKLKGLSGEREPVGEWETEGERKWRLLDNKDFSE